MSYDRKASRLILFKMSGAGVEKVVKTVVLPQEVARTQAAIKINQEALTFADIPVLKSRSNLDLSYRFYFMIICYSVEDLFDKLQSNNRMIGICYCPGFFLCAISHFAILTPFYSPHFLNWSAIDVLVCLGIGSSEADEWLPCFDSSTLSNVTCFSSEFSLWFNRQTCNSDCVCLEVAVPPGDTKLLLATDHGLVSSEPNNSSINHRNYLFGGFCLRSKVANSTNKEVKDSLENLLNRRLCIYLLMRICHNFVYKYCFG